MSCLSQYRWLSCSHITTLCICSFCFKVSRSGLSNWQPWGPHAAGEGLICGPQVPAWILFHPIGSFLQLLMPASTPAQHKMAQKAEGEPSGCSAGGHAVQHWTQEYRAAVGKGKGRACTGMQCSGAGMGLSTQCSDGDGACTLHQRGGICVVGGPGDL